MNGIVLYVDLLGLEAVVDRYNQIDMQMKALLSSYKSSISYLKECEYRGEIPSNILRVHNAEMQEIEERIRSLQSCLRTVLDIYRAYEKDFRTREMGNLYETTPIYKTNGFKIGVGVAVVAGSGSISGSGNRNRCGSRFSCRSSIRWTYWRNHRRDKGGAISSMDLRKECL